MPRLRWSQGRGRHKPAQDSLGKSDAIRIRRAGAGRTAREPAIRGRLGTRSIVLVGMPGCGKSAVGRRLAPRLELPFVDADEEIERAAGKTIKDIFKDHGEAYFRDGERKVIARLLARARRCWPPAAGRCMVGGDQANIRRSGISVWLKAELAVLVRRVTQAQQPAAARGRDPETRHAGADGGALSRLCRGRDMAVESRDVPHEAIVGEIVEALAQSPQLAEPAADSGRPRTMSPDDTASASVPCRSAGQSLGERSYDVLIGTGLLARGGRAGPCLSRGRAVRHRHR